MRLTIFLAAAATAALAACGAPADDTAPGANETVATADSGAAPLPTETGTEPTPAPTAIGEPAESGTIPVAMRGRWGLVPADCTSTRGDAKGLITVSANDIRFYESVGRLGAVRESDADSIRATWNYTGEGMTWTRDILWSVDGDTMVRSEFGDEAIPEPLTYTKCA